MTSSNTVRAANSAAASGLSAATDSVVTSLAAASSVEPRCARTRIMERVAKGDPEAIEQARKLELLP
jgi:hypothetical protein